LSATSSRKDSFHRFGYEMLDGILAERREHVACRIRRLKPWLRRSPLRSIRMSRFPPESRPWRRSGFSSLPRPGRSGNRDCQGPPRPAPARAQIIREPLRLLRQAQVGEISAETEHVRFLRNGIEQGLQGIRRVLMNVQVADGGDAQVIRLCAHFPLLQRPRIQVP